LKFTESFKTIPEFYFFADKYLSLGKEPAVIAFPVLLNAAPEELPKIASGRDISANISIISPDIFKLKIGLRKRAAEGYLLNHQSYWITIIQSEKKDSSVAEVALRWVQDMFPVVTPAYITSQQLIDLVESLNIVEGARITVLDYVTRSISEEETTKRWPKNLVFSKQAILAKVKRDNALVDAIRIRFSSPNIEFRAKLSRKGQIIFYDGAFSEFQRLVISKLVKLAKSNLDAMGKRERLISDGEVKLEPLSIRPERQLDKADMIRLRESLERKYMTAVLYGGNPWLLLSLIDKSDGSTFDLQAYHDEIIITPVIRVSAASLARLYSTLEEVLPTNLLKLPVRG